MPGVPDRNNWIEQWVLVCALIVLAIFLGSCAPPSNPPTATVPEGELLLRAQFLEPTVLPDELSGKMAPAVLLDPTDRRTGRLWAPLLVECNKQFADLLKEPCELSFGNLSEQRQTDFKTALQEVLPQTDSYVWFQPKGFTDLLPGPWGAVVWTDEDEKLFVEWFTNPNSIIVLEATAVLEHGVIQ